MRFSKLHLERVRIPCMCGCHRGLQYLVAIYRRSIDDYQKREKLRQRQSLGKSDTKKCTCGREISVSSCCDAMVTERWQLKSRGGERSSRRLFFGLAIGVNFTLNRIPPMRTVTSEALSMSRWARSNNIASRSREVSTVVFAKSQFFRERQRTRLLFVSAKCLCDPT